MLRLIHDEGLLEPAMELMGKQIDFYLRRRAHDQFAIGAIVFTEDYGMLCTTGPAAEWLEEIKQQNERNE